MMSLDYAHRQIQDDSGADADLPSASAMQVARRTIRVDY